MKYWIVFVNVLVNILLWIFCPVVFPIIHILVFFVVLFVYDVDRQAANYAKRRLISNIKEKTKKARQFSFLKFGLKDICK